MTLPAKLPPTDALRCDLCGGRELAVSASTFDAAWKEIHAAGWMLVSGGARRGQWKLACPACKPQGDPAARGLDTGMMMGKR